MVKQEQIGWGVLVHGQWMVWPVESKKEAVTYCEDEAEPVPLMANCSTVRKHEKAQGEV